MIGWYEVDLKGVYFYVSQIMLFLVLCESL